MLMEGTGEGGDAQERIEPHTHTHIHTHPSHGTDNGCQRGRGVRNH